METIKNRIHVLGIESSCDDTGVAIVRDDGKILSNCINSQLKQHLINGGIIPVVAKDYHINNIDKVANEAFKKSGLESVANDIDAIAVTTRPGFDFSLQVGFNYAKKLAIKYSKPLIPIHHMQAHSLMPLLQNKSIRFPYLTLLISGGHCILAIASRYNKFDLLGTSKDEAPGELLDKVARRLKLKNLGPPFDNISGGAAIEQIAKREGADKFKYFNYLPMSQKCTCDFSFTGYRSSLEKVYPIVDQLWSRGNHRDLITELSHICASLQRAILIQFVKKLQRAFFYYRMKWRYENEEAFCNAYNLKHIDFEILNIDNHKHQIDIVVSGGVAANNYIIDGLKLGCKECIDSDIKIYAPSKELCSDNGLMVAWNGLLRFKEYLDYRTNFKSRSFEDSVLIDKNDINSITVDPESPIGTDLRAKVSMANFKMPRLAHKEFKLLTDRM